LSLPLPGGKYLKNRCQEEDCRCQAMQMLTTNGQPMNIADADHYYGCQLTYIAEDEQYFSCQRWSFQMAHIAVSEKYVLQLENGINRRY
jgi:hypothetical protein